MNIDGTGPITGELDINGGLVINNSGRLGTVKNLKWNSTTNTLIIDGTLQAGDMIYSFEDLEGQIADANNTANNALDIANDAFTAANTALNTANTALNTANTALNTANSAVDNANGRVSKAGDTMTGGLTAPSIRVGSSSQVTLVPDGTTGILLNSTDSSNTSTLRFRSAGVSGSHRIIMGYQNAQSYTFESFDALSGVREASIRIRDNIASRDVFRYTPQSNTFNVGAATLTASAITASSLRSADAILTGTDVGGKKYFDVTSATANSAGLRVTSPSLNAEIALNSNGGTSNYLFQSTQFGNLIMSETVSAKNFFLYERAADRITLSGDVSINGVRVATTGVDSFTNDQLPSTYNVGYTLGGGNSTMPFTSGTLFTARANTTRGLQLLVSKNSTSLLFRSINTIDDWGPWGELMQEQKHITNTSATATNRVWSSQQTKTYADSLINNTSTVSSANAWSSQQTKTYVDNAVSGATPIDARRVYYYRVTYTHNGFNFTYDYEPVFTTNVRNNGVGFGNLAIATENGIQFFDLTCTRPAGLPGASAPIYSLIVEDWKGEFANTLLVPQILQRSPSGSVKFALRNANGNYVALTKPVNRETYTYEIVFSLVLDWNY